MVVVVAVVAVVAVVVAVVVTTAGARRSCSREGEVLLKARKLNFLTPSSPNGSYSII